MERPISAVMPLSRSSSTSYFPSRANRTSSRYHSPSPSLSSPHSSCRNLDRSLGSMESCLFDQGHPVTQHLPPQSRRLTIAIKDFLQRTDRTMDRYERSSRSRSRFVYKESSVSEDEGHTRHLDDRREPSATSSILSSRHHEFEDLQTEVDQAREQLIQFKMMKDAELKSLYEELEEVKQVSSEWQSKHARLTTKYQDCRLALEESERRNVLLENKIKQQEEALACADSVLRENKRTEEQLQHLRAQSVEEQGNLQSRILVLEKELATNKEVIVSLKKTIDDLQSDDTTEILQKELQANRKELTKLRDELRDSQETFDYVASENKKTQENYEHMLKKAHIELSRKDEELDETIKLYKSRIKNLELELEESDFVARKLTKQKQDLETRAVESEASLINIHQEEMNALRVKLRRHRSLLKHARLKQETRGSERRAQRFRNIIAMVDELTDERVAQEKRFMNLQREYKETVMYSEELSHQNETTKSKIMEASREKRQLEIRLDEMEENLTEAEQEVGNLTRKMSNLSAEVVTARERCNILQEEKETLLEEIDDLKKKLFKSQPEMINSENLVELSKRIVELEGNLSVTEFQKKRYESQVDRLKDCLESQQRELQETQGEVLRHEASVRELRRLLSNSNDDSLQTTTRLKECQAKLQRAILEIELSTKETEETKLEIQNLKSLNQSLERALADTCDSSSGSDSTFQDFSDDPESEVFQPAEDVYSL